MPTAASSAGRRRCCIRGRSGYRVGQFTASGGAAVSTWTDKGQRAALLPAMLRNQVPWWPEHVLTRRGGAAVEKLARAQSRRRSLAGVGGFRPDRRAPAHRDPDSVGRALLGARVSAVGGAQSGPRRRPALHAHDETAHRRAGPAPTRHRRSVRARRPGPPNPALRPADPLRIRARRRPFRARGATVDGHLGAVDVPAPATRL